MKSKEIRKKSESDILKLLKEKEKKLKDIMFSGVDSKSKNTKEMLGLRRDVARIKTILKENKEEKNGK